MPSRDMRENGRKVQFRMPARKAVELGVLVAGDG